MIKETLSLLMTEFAVFSLLSHRVRFNLKVVGTGTPSEQRSDAEALQNGKSTKQCSSVNVWILSYL